MFMNLRHYRLPAEQVDEVLRRVDDIWTDRVSKLPGFVTYYVARTDPDRLTTITVFLEEPQAKKAAEASAEWVGAYLMDLDVEFVDMWQGPVVAHAGA